MSGLLNQFKLEIKCISHGLLYIFLSDDLLFTLLPVMLCICISYVCIENFKVYTIFADFVASPIMYEMLSTQTSKS